MPFPRALRLFLRSRFIRVPIVTPLVCTLALAGAVGSATAATAWTDGQDATLVLGADNLTTAGGGSPSATRFVGPTDICTDAATGKVFVIVHNQHRILRFSTAEAIKNGGSAEAVFGQPDLTIPMANNGGLSAKSLKQPMTCTINAAGQLFVTDVGNRRVLRYDNAASKPSFADADGVLGQQDFTTMVTDTAANRFGAGLLYGIALGPGGVLYVSDPGNRRVLRFDQAASKPNGADADGVLGAVEFNTPGAVGSTESTFSSNIAGLTVDAAGNLYVSDMGNRRILRFDNAASKANGAAADGVLGAANLTTAGSASSASASNMSAAVFGIDVLADGALYAADFTFNRVLVYNNPAAKANGAEADHVLGQADFTSTAQATTASGVKSPLGLGYNAQAGYLMIPDYSNNRVVGHFAESLKPNAAPTASSVTITGTPIVGQQLTGDYAYADADGDNEGASTFVWKRGSTVISGATALQYVLVADDVDQTLTFCVTPVASAGTATGTQACSAPTATVTQGPVNGACGSVHNSGSTNLLTSAPSADLCSTGTASSITSGTSTFTWSCAGTGGGNPASCQAPRGYSVIPSAGANGSLSPDSEQVVAYHATPSFTLTPDAGYVVDGVNGTCNGSISGNTYTTAAVIQNCAFIANFQPAPTYTITASVHANVGGTASCSSATVTHGGSATCTATPATHYRFNAWTGACAGQGATCTLTNIQAAQASTAVFTYEITVPEGPQKGQPVGVTPPAQNNWTINSASTAPTNSIATPPPSTVELPQGIVALQLATGTVGSSATVVLTYPEPFPTGTKYYKFGKTQANRTEHWYEFSGAVINGNTITLTLTDGAAGDSDLTADGFIDDPGGPARPKVVPPPPDPSPINGACGSSHGQTLPVAPQTNLCVRGTASSVSGMGPWSWSCSGQYGGRNASCSASISTYLVTTTAGEGGRISPAQRSVDHGKSTSFSVQADSGYRLASVSGCNGSLTGTRYFIASVTGACRVQATFTNAPTPTQGPVLDEDFVRQQYLDFLHRAADGAGLAYWQEQLRTGQITRAELVQRFLDSGEFQGRIAPIVRLYFAYFGRVPDYAGLQFWINTMYPQGTPSGLDLHSVSQGFAASVEFERTYGALSDLDFVRLVYRNVLDREPDSAGQAHWLAQLQNGLPRGSLMTQFSESAEYRDFSQYAGQVVMAYVGLLRRSPETAGLDHWLNYLEQGGSFIELIDGFLRAPEYNQRFMAL